MAQRTRAAATTAAVTSDIAGARKFGVTIRRKAIRNARRSQRIAGQGNGSSDASEPGLVTAFGEAQLGERDGDRDTPNGVVTEQRLGPDPIDSGEAQSTGGGAGKIPGLKIVCITSPSSIKPYALLRHRIAVHGRTVRRANSRMSTAPPP